MENTENSSQDKTTHSLHHGWMQKTLDAAREARDRGEVPVGCLFVYDGRAIANGSNRVTETKNATRHAEMIAIDEVLQSCKVNGLDSAAVFHKTTVYVTVEPCVMCTMALRQLGVALVVYGCANERFGGCGSIVSANGDELPGWPVKLECIPGFAADEAVDMLKQFYKGENPNAPESKRKPART